MPQIVVRTNGPDGQDEQEVLHERVAAVDLETDTSTALLIERIGWALSDAEDLERGKDPYSGTRAA